MKKKYVEYLVLLVLGVVISTLVVSIIKPKSESMSTGSTLYDIKQRGTLRAGIPVAGLPVATRDESGNIVGFLPDIAEEMAKALEVKLEIIDTTDPNRFPYLQNGTIDFAWGTITLPRNEVVSFSRPADLGAQSAVVLNTSDISDYENLKGKKIVVVTGTTGDIIATKLYPDNEFIRVDQISTAIQSIQSGQADICIGDWSAFFLAQKTDPQLILLPIIRYEGVGFMLPHGDNIWKEWVDNFLNDLYATGTTTSGNGREIYLKWLQMEPNPDLFRWY